MPRINGSDSLGAELADLRGRVARLENATRSAVAVVTADPANVRNGDTWAVGASFRIRLNGVTRTVTVT